MPDLRKGALGQQPLFHAAQLSPEDERALPGLRVWRASIGLNVRRPARLSDPPSSDRRRAGEVRRRGLLRYRAPRNAPLALGLPRLHIP